MRLGRGRSFPPWTIIAVLAFGLLVPRPAAAAAAAGTAITNTTTAAYSDAGGTALSTTSNTITTYVQNAPALTATAPGNQNVTPAMYVVDTFTLTNTGNAAGTFALSTDAAFTGTASAPTLAGYVLAGASSGTCSVASPCSMSTLNAQSGMGGIGATSGSVTVGVEYTVASGSTNNQTIITTLSVNIIYASVTGGVAETSANVTAAPTDTVQTDARLDVQATVSGPSSSGGNITWTIRANNGGGKSALDLSSTQTVLGAGAAGIALFIPTPSFSGTYLTLQAQPSAPTVSGAASGATAAIYYNATACASHPTTSWSTTYSASAECMAVYVSGGAAGAELPSNAGTSAGSVSSGQAQITMSFVTNQPSGAGSGNTNSVTLVATGAIGATVGATGSTPILGQGVTMGTQDAATASLLNGIQTNTTASSGTTAPGGASNQIGDGAFAAYTLLNGPYGLANATGWYPGATGAPAADNMHDYEVANVPCTSNGSAGVNGIACTVSGSGAIFINDVQNTGNSSDSIQLTAVAPTGYKVQLFNASSCSGGGSTWPTCTQGSSITSLSTSGGSVSGTASVASGATLSYEAVYTASGNSATAFTAYTTKITAAGQSGSGTGTDTNDTYNTVYPGGVMKLADAVTATTTNCPAGESAPPSGLACPGGTLSFTIAYANQVPVAVDGNKGTEPTFAYNSCYAAAGSFIITDDSAANPSGATAANNWVAYGNNLAAAVTDTTAGTIITYYPSASTTFSAAQTKFTAKIGGNAHQVVPGDSGTVTFTVVVK